MRKLDLEEMGTTTGGLSWAGFGCGFGIVALVFAPAVGIAGAEMTVAMCAIALSE